MENLHSLMNASLPAGSKYIKGWSGNNLGCWLWEEGARIDMDSSWRLQVPL